MLKLAMVAIFVYIPTTIKDVENVKTEDGITTAVLIFNDEVPNRPANIFITVSDARKVHLKLTPIGTEPNTKRLQVRWTERTQIDAAILKEATCSIFPK